MHKAGRNISIFAVTFDNGNLDYIFFEIGFNAVRANLQIEFEAFRYDLARNYTDCTRLAAVGMRAETGSADFRCLDAIAPDRSNSLASGKQIL